MSVSPVRDNAALRDEIISSLAPTYELVYVAYDDKLSDAQIDMLARDDMEALWEDTAEWESDQRWESCKQIIAELAQEVTREWENEDWESITDTSPNYSDLAADFYATEEYDEVRFEIEERDRSDWVKQLADNSGSVMMRIASPITEDESLSYQEVSPAQLLARLSLEPTQHNVNMSADIIGNASPEYGVMIGYWLASVEISDLYAMPSDTTHITITNPGFWLGNPFAGSGYAEQFEGTITIERADMHTDKGAFGYSWQEVSGCYPSAFPVTFEPVPVPVNA